jgi:hypothetical protein
MAGSRADKNGNRIGTSMRWGVVGTLLAGLLLVASGAAAQQTTTPGATVTVSATPATPASSPIPSPTATSTPVNGYVAANAELDDIVWARDIDPKTNAPVRVATGFITTDAAIYATFAVKRIDAGVTVTAEWSLNGTVVPSLNASIALDQGYQDGWIEFHLTKAEGEIWPIGTYTIDIKIDGTPALTSDIEVTVPPS